MGSGQSRGAGTQAIRLLWTLLWQFGLPGLGLFVFAYRDRYDGRPDYVVPWFIFAALIGAAWTTPLFIAAPRHQRFRPAIPMWIWPWLALTGVLLYRQ